MARQPNVLNELTQDAAPTFMTGVERDTGPDYHCMIRIVGEQHNPAMGVFSADTLDDAVNNWLSSNYELHTISELGPVEIPGQPLAGFRFAYHFVKK